MDQVLQFNQKWRDLPLFKRTGWRRIPFGAFAESINDRVEPTDAADDVYVGLDDLDPGSLHIRRWGKGSDVIGTKLRFRKGDIIFGRRRAYQRKLAVAEMDGICSAHSMVVRAKPEVALPEFLPFLMVSDKFMNRAVEISVGSLSPTINWTALRLEEFYLPSLDDQRQIAEVLWMLDEVINGWAQTAQSLRLLHEARLREVFNDSNVQWPSRPLANVARVERGKFSHRPRNLAQFYGGQHPFVQTGDVQNSSRVLNKFEYYLTDLGTTYSRSFPAGTIFVTIAAVIGATAICDQEVFATDSVVAVVPSADMDVNYLELFLRHQRHFLETKAATQTAQKNINLQILRPLAVPCPPRSRQVELAMQILAPLHIESDVQRHIDQLRSLVKAFLREVTHQ